MNKLIKIVIALAFTANAHAEVISIKSDKVNNAKINEAGIYLTGGINNKTVSWLMSGLANIHANYRNVKSIDLYINSGGGSMDASYTAYEFLRNFPVKINIINASLTASAATIVYCASPERYVMPMAKFVLHPAATQYENEEIIKPDQARRILEEDEIYNGIFQKVYASCTTLTPEELTEITSSESGRKIYNAEQAIKNGLVTKGIRESRSYLLTYFISDTQD